MQISKCLQADKIKSGQKIDDPCDSIVIYKVSCNKCTQESLPTSCFHKKRTLARDQIFNLHILIYINFVNKRQNSKKISHLYSMNKYF